MVDISCNEKDTLGGRQMTRGSCSKDTGVEICEKVKGRRINAIERIQKNRFTMENPNGKYSQRRINYPFSVRQFCMDSNQDTNEVLWTKFEKVLNVVCVRRIRCYSFGKWGNRIWD